MRHVRPDRGPYYTLAGRRLSVVLLGELEARRLIARAGRDRAAYHLTPLGEQVLAAGERPDPLQLPWGERAVGLLLRQAPNGGADFSPPINGLVSS